MIENLGISIAILCVVILAYRLNQKRLEQMRERERRERFDDKPRTVVVNPGYQVLTFEGCRSWGMVTKTMKRDPWGYWREVKEKDK